MRKTQRLTTCLILAAVAGCMDRDKESSEVEFTPADSTAVHATADKWVSTMLAQNFDGWGQTVASDVVMYPPNSKPLMGRDAAIAYVKAYPTITKFNITVDELTGHGDDAFDRGTFMLDAKLPNGTAISDTGSFMSAFHRQADGSWAHSRVMWVSHLPPPPAPAAPAPPPRRAK